MGNCPAASDQRLRNAGVRSLDHPVAGFLSAPERISSTARFRGDVPGGTIRNCYDSVIAWTSVVIASAAGGAAITLITGAKIRW